MYSHQCLRVLALVLVFGFGAAWILGLSGAVAPVVLNLDADVGIDAEPSVVDETGRAEQARDAGAGAGAGFPGERQIQALARAYPERIIETELREGQWAARIDDTWYYYAEGRMLPRELVSRYDEFTPLRLRPYETGPAELREVDDEFAERLRTRDRERAEDPPTRHNGFLDALYQVSSAREAEQRMVRIRFLGLSTRVHPKIVEPLERVEAEIRDSMQHDAEVRSFVESLRTASGFFWREIAGTASRSYHSYGIAIDLIPHSYEGRYGYWRWAKDAGIEEWWELPFERRWEVPQPVVDAFEAQEFIWGGKWLSFDPIHFEYRPERFILGGYRD